MNNQINQVVDQIEYYTKEETLYLCLLSELISQRDHLRREKERAKEAIAKGESPSCPDQFRNHFEDQVFGYYRNEDGDFEDAEGDLFSPIEGLDSLNEHNPDVYNELLIEFLSQQICDYAWIVEYNQELFDKKDFSSLNSIFFGWKVLESDIPLLSKNKDVSDFYYKIRESDKGNWIRDDIDEFMTEIEYGFSEDQLIALDSVWSGKVGDEFVEREIDPNELNYQRKDLIKNNLE